MSESAVRGATNCLIGKPWERQPGQMPSRLRHVRDRQRGARARHRAPDLQIAVQKGAPGLRRGLLLVQQGAAYRLTWRLVPPPGAPLPASPLETSLTQSEFSPLKYEVSLAVRSASRLV